MVVAFMVLELGLLVYKFRVGKWTHPLAWTNAIIHTASIIVFFVFVGNPDLYNPEVIPYFADIIKTNVSSVENTMNWIWWSMICTVAIAIAIEIFDSFRKARI
jgi:hypothetical protein